MEIIIIHHKLVGLLSNVLDLRVRHKSIHFPMPLLALELALRVSDPEEAPLVLTLRNEPGPHVGESGLCERLNIDVSKGEVPLYHQVRCIVTLEMVVAVLLIMLGVLAKVILLCIEVHRS